MPPMQSSQRWLTCRDCSQIVGEGAVSPAPCGHQITERIEGMEERLPREVPKPWGSELWFAHTDRYAGKILRVRAGCRLSVQFHEEKDETSFVLSGRVIVSQGESPDTLTTLELGPGDSWRNLPLVIHTLEAVEDDHRGLDAAA
jgi:mannose-6-phosphate isomerase